MALESKDFDDQSIMRATQQENGANDTFRLKITMPLSGREVTSEWVRQDKRKEALFAWVNAVRVEAQADIAEYERERKEKALKERAKQSSIVDSAGVPVSSTPLAAVAPSGPAALPAPFSSSLTNPDDYIADQLKRAMIREAETCDAALAAQRAHGDAIANLAKWQKLANALQGESK